MLARVGTRMLLFMGQNPNKKCYSSLLAKKLNITLSHCVKMSKLLVDNGFLIKEDNQHHRCKYLCLTNKGKKVAKEIIKVKKIIKI